MNRTALLTALTATAAFGLSAPALAAAPPNDDLTNAATLTTLDPAAKFYTLSQATKEANEVIVPGAAGHTVWYRWAPDEVGTAAADVCGAQTGGHHVRAYRLPPGQAATLSNLLLAYHTPQDNPIKSTACLARFRALKNQTYYLQVDRGADASYSNTIDVSLDVEGPPAPVVAQPNPITGPLSLLHFKTGGDTALTMCGVNGGDAKPCTSGFQLGPVPGGHATVRVMAFDANGNFSAEVKKEWTVDAVAPKTTITAPPATVAHDAQPKIAFSVADEHPGSSSACKIDGGEWEPCAAPYRMPVLGAGKHTLAVRSTDVAGNTEATAVTASYTVLEGPKPVVVPAPPVKVEQPSVTPPPAACTLSLKAPKSVKRSALKRGLRKAIKLGVETTGPCTAKVAMKRRGGKVDVVVTAGSLERTASVKVR